MESLNNLKDIINVYNIYKEKEKWDHKRIEFGEKIIQVVGKKVYYNYLNNTEFKNIILDFNQMEKLNKINKFNLNFKTKIKYHELDLFIEKKQFNYEVFQKLELKSNKTNIEFKVKSNFLKTSYEDSVINETVNEFENYEFIGKLTPKQINDLLKIKKNQKKLTTDYNNYFNNIFVQNNRYIITNSYQMISSCINLKDCVLNIEKITEHKNCNEINIYADPDYYYYKSNVITNKISKSEIETKLNGSFTIYNDHTIKAENCFFVNIEKWKMHKTEIVRLNLSESIITFIDNNQNTYDINFDIITENFIEDKKLIPLIEFRYDNFINIFNLIEIKNEVLIKIPEKINEPFFIDSHLIMPLRISNDNYIEYTKKEIKTTIPVTTEIEPKKLTEVNNMKPIQKTKKVKTLSNEIVLVRPKRIEPVKELEIVKELEPVKEIELKEIVKEIENFATAEVINIEKISETVITPNFDFIDFIYINCFNELENLNFYNTDYKNNRLYLENIELTFNQLNNKIEINELNIDFENKFYYVNDKKELLKLVREKIKTAA